MNQTYLLDPTNTLTSSYSTPTNGSSGDNSISDVLSSNGSPPLIVAFLAIGLFVVVMIAVFAWRRLSHSRGVYHQPIAANLRPKAIPPGKRPMLWDLWSGIHVGEKSLLGATRWENMTPMAAVLTCPIPPVKPPVASTGPRDPGGRVLVRTLRWLVSAIKRFYLPDPLPPPPLPPPLSAEVEKEVAPPALRTLDEMEWGDASSLQVFAIVAMPTQRRCRRGTPEEDTDPEQTELGEFCIGEMDVPWNEMCMTGVDREFRHNVGSIGSTS